MSIDATALYLIPTPIGNLEDITLRALRLLKEVDLVLAEDTRTSGKLMKHYQITTPLKSYHAHNEHKVVDHLVDEMLQGKKIALITDAGTPAISDPGFLICRACFQKGVQFECLPGATAFVPALVKSGFPSDRFVFEGFLPHKKGRKSRMERFIDEERSVIFYESPFRLVKLLEQFKEVYGAHRLVSVSRELTKIHEETITGTIDSVLQYYQTRTVKGEIVVVLAGSNYNPDESQGDFN